jgi:hypothetical protein
VSRAAPPGPRQAPGPRSGGAERGPGGRRLPGDRRHATHAFAPGYAAREPEATKPPEARTAPDGAPVEAEPLTASGASSAQQGGEDAREIPSAPPGELSGLRLLLDQLDAMLRDPTLTRALRRFVDRIASSLRELASAIRLPRLRLPRLPRWLLLVALLLLLAVGLPALLAPGDDKRSVGAPPSGEVALPGVGMPDLRAALDDPPPARVALVVDRTYSAAALRRELRSLGAGVGANHAPGTRVTRIDAATGRSSAPLSATTLARGATTRAQTGTSAAIRSALHGRGRRLLVDVGSPAPASSASTLTVLTRRGAGAPASVPLRRGGRSRVAIDDRRPDALAASVARALIAISGQSERR